MNPLQFALAISLVLLLALASAGPIKAADLVNDRLAVERVYYEHRLGEKPPFERMLPRETLERLVRLDLHKEAILRKSYGMEITPAMLDAEVQRINTSTRAPEVLAELKSALGNDATRFAQTVARPLVVDRLLRERFENDDALHAAQRCKSERVREQLLKASAATNGLIENLVAILKNSPCGSFSETTWQLSARPEDKPGARTPDEIEIKNRLGPNAQIISSPQGGNGKERRFYFEDLPDELQRVLRIQLRECGDVSAVIETPGGFLLYVAKEKTDAMLCVTGLSVPKRSYEQWLEEQSKNQP